MTLRIRRIEKGNCRYLFSQLQQVGLNSDNRFFFMDQRRRERKIDRKKERKKELYGDRQIDR